jgi:hypothetical protein
MGYRNVNSRFLALGAVAFTVALSSDGLAYCRMRACDRTPVSWSPYPPPCVEDEETECLLYGKKLHWPTNCLSISIQKDGSALSGIDAETASAIIEAAFETWRGADCGGGETPSFSLVNLGEIECRLHQFNQRQPNANVFLFRDGDWPYKSSEGIQIALTTSTYEFERGEILDSDVEFNTHEWFFSVTDEERAGIDFASVATHEIGHFLGLSHTLDATAAMFKSGNGRRTLEADDIAGICELYPPGNALSERCPVRHGYSGTCGDPAKELVEAERASCAVASPRVRVPCTGFVSLALGALLTFVVRRRARRVA